jgi:hypothetical protein
MSEPISNTSATVESIRVPAALRSAIIENNLAANDIILLLLIIERTLSNVFPAKPSAALSIRYIKEQNQCSVKGAENSVKKLKNLKLITHEVFPDTMRAGVIGLNCETLARYSPRTVGTTERPPAGPVVESDAVAGRRRVQDEISEIRQMLFDAVNGGKKKREEELPDPFLAALFLDHFRTSEAVESFLNRFNADVKRRKVHIRGYGFYDHVIRNLRDSAVYERYLDSIRTTEPMDVITAPAFDKRGTSAVRNRRIKPSFVGWQVDDHERGDLEAALFADIAAVEETGVDHAVTESATPLPEAGAYRGQIDACG